MRAIPSKILPLRKIKRSGTTCLSRTSGLENNATNGPQVRFSFVAGASPSLAKGGRSALPHRGHRPRDERCHSSGVEHHLNRIDDCHSQLSQKSIYMKTFRNIIFSLKHRISNGSRVSIGVYIKGFENIRLGRNCKIHDSSSLDASRKGRIEFGQRVTINRYADLKGGAGGVKLGDGVEINNQTVIDGTGGIEIGNDTLIGPGARIISYQHEHAAGKLIRLQPTVGKSIKIGSGVWIGANAVILAGITIGDGAVIGAGAVVTKDIPPNAIAVGVPARVKSYRT
ncbi:hypothetical protein CKO20_15725 [Rhodocyclus tenuis]|nr:hypothetical protein [Rhodocyclus tenuis]